MFSKKLLNSVKLCFGMILCSLAVLLTPAMSITTYASNGDIELCTEYREWVFKIMNDKMYKRLYNASTGLYETDWIYVCDWPPEDQ